MSLAKVEDLYSVILGNMAGKGIGTRYTKHLESSISEFILYSVIRAINGLWVDFKGQEFGVKIVYESCFILRYTGGLHWGL